MYCRVCGKEVADGSTFCSACGNKLEEPVVVNVTTQIQEEKPTGKPCPKCGKHSIQYQTVTESRKTGCGTIILYILLACTILGLFIVIPLMLRKKTETVTYAVCQNCGHRWRV